MSLIELQAAGTEVVPGRDPFLALAAVHDALDELEEADLEQLDGDWLGHLVRATDRLATRSLAAAVTVSAEVERRGHGRESGFFTTKAYLRHHGLLSGPEALMRTKISRLFDLLPVWSVAAHAGDVGVDQVRLMALVASNPRIHDALVEGGGDELLIDAQWAPYDLFEERARNFARLADPEGDAETGRRRDQERDVRMRQRPDGSWRLSGTFGSLQGAEINDILAHFNQAEFETDWAEARDLLGIEQPAVSDLSRVESQRRADALTAALLRGAQSPGDGKAPLPTLHVLIDADTLERLVTGAALDAMRFRDAVCRTQNGDLIDLTEAARLSLWGDIRRTVVDQRSVVTDLGQRSRVYRGSNREAALLLFESCVWPGCDQRVRTCQADHAVSWLQHGNTDPSNAMCLCGRHNRFKHTARFQAVRNEFGEWMIISPETGPIDRASCADFDLL